ncbi:MAG: ABC transporter permease [Anaerolineales bacterium]
MSASRLFSTIAHDVRLQFRSGFYYASAFVGVIMVLLITGLPDFDMRPLWAPIILENLVINAFYFMSGLVLLEKGEGILQSLVVSPLRDVEYLSSKVISLTVLSIFETLLIVVLVSGLAINWLLLLVGLLILIGVLALYGFVVVARYDSISEFLMPSVLWTFGISLPLLYYFNLWRTPLMFLHPIQAPLVLIQAAFQSIPGWQIGYGLAYGSLWLAITLLLSRRAFHRFVVRKEGASS